VESEEVPLATPNQYTGPIVTAMIRQDKLKQDELKSKYFLCFRLMGLHGPIQDTSGGATLWSSGEGGAFIFGFGGQ